MIIQEAIKSGKPFKRPNDQEWSWLCKRTRYLYTGTGPQQKDFHSITADDLLAEDWEIMEEKIAITQRDLAAAWNGAFCNLNLSINRDPLFPASCSDFFTRFKYNLGFQE